MYIMFLQSTAIFMFTFFSASTYSKSIKYTHDNSCLPIDAIKKLSLDSFFLPLFHTYLYLYMCTNTYKRTHMLLVFSWRYIRLKSILFYFSFPTAFAFFSFLIPSFFSLFYIFCLLIYYVPKKNCYR